MKMDLSLGNGSRYHESPCLDPIRNHTVCRPGKVVYPLDLDNISAGTFNTCAHCHEAIGKIDHLRLARSIFKDSIPLCQRRRHHQVLSAGHRHGIKNNLGALQPMLWGAGLDIALLNCNGCTHLFERVDM